MNALKFHDGEKKFTKLLPKISIGQKWQDSQKAWL